jgi:hypothetical protein
MAVEDLSPARVSGGTEEFRALLGGYAGVLEAIDGAPPVLWAGLERPRILRWLRFPASRALVSILLVRHVSRCRSALERGAARRRALADDAPEPRRDVKILKQFKQSLPTDVRLAVIAPLAGLGILFFAFILAKFVFKARYTKLLADLTTAALTLDRGAALAAFEKNHGAPTQYLGATLVIAYSVTLVIAPLLPAFSVKRRLLRPLAGLEARGFAALGCRRVQDLELDLVAQLVLITALASFGAISLWLFASPVTRARYNARVGENYAVTPIFALVTGALVFFLVSLAAVELRNRYAMRRTDTARRPALITRFMRFITRSALRLSLVAAVALFIDNVALHLLLRGARRGV